MSLIETEHYEQLARLHTAEQLEALKIRPTDERADGHVAKIEELAKGIGGFVAYFVIGDEVHDDQHELFCDKVGISSDDLHPRKYPHSFFDGFTTVLTREVQIDHDETVYGVHYYVEHVPSDKD